MTRRITIVVALLVAAIAHRSTAQGGAQKKAAPPSGGSVSATLVANERAAWQAFKDKNSAAFVKGEAPGGMLMVDGTGVSTPSAEEIGKLMAGCEFRSYS